MKPTTRRLNEIQLNSAFVHRRPQISFRKRTIKTDSDCEHEFLIVDKKNEENGWRIKTEWETSETEKLKK